MNIFGPGVITATLNGVTNPTPINIGLAQEISFEEKGNLKELYGQNRRAIAVGAGTIKASGKIKAARFSASALSLLLYGVQPLTGQTTTAVAEAHSVPAVTTYTATVNNITGWSDEGVQYASGAKAGQPLTRVATPTAAGQYSCAAGVYTFFSGDASAAVWITYNYNITGTGFSVPVGNPLLGPTISFGLNIAVFDPNGSGVGTFQVFNAVMAGFTLGTKLEDFAMPEYDYSAYANAAGQFGQWNFPDNS